MTVETHAHRALDRVERELSELEAKGEALGAFADRVAGVTAVQPGCQRTAGVTGGGVAGVTGRAGGDGLGEVRAAFAETVAPHTGEGNESTLESMRAELGREVALALSTASTITPGLRKQVLARAESRREEIAVTRRALHGERDSLEGALDTVETVTEWLAEANRTPLSDLGFEALAARHERLAEYRRACVAVLESRQEFVDGTTSRGAAVGVGHRQLVASLYEGFPVDYPVLSTVTRLVDLIEGCQRAVRNHLVRRA